MRYWGLIVAAGLSSRMGEFKPLLRIGSKTLIEYTVDSMFAGGIAGLTITLGYRAGEVERILRRTWPADKVHIATNHCYAETDMLASVKIGLRARAPDRFMRDEAFFLLPGDMPAVRKETFRVLADRMETTTAKLIFPVVAGKRGHPPLISVVCVPDILDYEGKEGLRGLWERYRGEDAESEVQDRGCLMDADTMANYHALVEYMQEHVQSVRSGGRYQFG